MVLSDRPHATADTIAESVRREVGAVDCVVGVAPCLEPSGDFGFEVDEAEVVFWGTCPECRHAKEHA